MGEWFTSTEDVKNLVMIPKMGVCIGSSCRRSSIFSGICMVEQTSTSWTCWLEAPGKLRMTQCWDGFFGIQQSGDCLPRMWIWQGHIHARPDEFCSMMGNGIGHQGQRFQLYLFMPECVQEFQLCKDEVHKFKEGC